MQEEKAKAENNILVYKHTYMYATFNNKIVCTSFHYRYTMCTSRLGFSFLSFVYYLIRCVYTVAYALNSSSKKKNNLQEKMKEKGSNIYT